MNAFTRRYAVSPLVLCVLGIAFAFPALGGIRDYQFQLAQSELEKGEGAVIAVKLIDNRSGKPVPDAVISAKRIDMAPDGMATMKATLQELPSTEPGVYRFKADLPMAGRWQLSLAAKVQGETGTVESKLVLKVLP